MPESSWPTSIMIKDWLWLKISSLRFLIWMRRTRIKDQGGPVEDAVPPRDPAPPRVSHPVLAPLDRVPLGAEAAVQLLWFAHDGVLFAVVVLREVQLAWPRGSEKGEKRRKRPTWGRGGRHRSVAQNILPPQLQPEGRRRRRWTEQRPSQRMGFPTLPSKIALWLLNEDLTPIREEAWLGKNGGLVRWESLYMEAGQVEIGTKSIWPTSHGWWTMDIIATMTNQLKRLCWERILNLFFYRVSLESGLCQRCCFFRDYFEIL